MLKPIAYRAVSVPQLRHARRRRLLGWCLAWLCVPMPAPAQLPPAASIPFPEEYVMLIETCRSGELTARRLCGESLRGWPAERLAGALAGIRNAHSQAQREAQEATRMDDATLAFGALLHTDLAFDALVAPNQDAARAHLDMAGGLLRLLPDATAVPDLRRRWILAVGCRYRRDFELDEARSWLKAGLAAYPGDARLLLALGSADELMATYRNPVCPSVAECPSARERERYKSVEWQRRSHATSAAELYRQALASDPGLIEARLRLGRVLWLHVSKERGREALRELAPQAQPESLAYLAHLFLGAALEDGAAQSEAVAHYRSAVSLRPGGQAARFALAQALRRSGDRAGEREVLRPLLTTGTTQLEPDSALDPWWIYALGPGACDPDEWHTLRSEAGF